MDLNKNSDKNNLIKKFSKASLGRAFICRLEFESDLLRSVINFAKNQKINTATFSAIGALKNANISYYNQNTRTYEKWSINKPVELLSCIGNISKKDGEIWVHAHILVSDSDRKTYGGHLDFGTKIFACELSIMVIPDINLKRKLDDETGLSLFSFESRIKT